mmetsp:Transcript_14660/g.62900  ORF Transcript_14660/g.62900 Transcript_14660/m.62900 type:complete len:240 (+) Transcript_14660:816-1535(+)
MTSFHRLASAVTFSSPPPVFPLSTRVPSNSLECTNRLPLFPREIRSSSSRYSCSTHPAPRPGFGVRVLRHTRVPPTETSTVLMRTSVRESETAWVGAVAETVSGPRSTRFSSVSSLLRIWKLSLATPAKSFWKKLDDSCCCDQRNLHLPRSELSRAGAGVGLSFSSSSIAARMAASSLEDASSSASMFCCAPNRASFELPVKTRTLAVDAPSSADARASARDRGARARRREDAWVRAPH